MKRAVIYSAVLFAVVLCISCKKKTSIEVNVHNYALAEPIANAKVVLVERHIGGIFGAAADCKEIASAVTDEAGNCSFEKEKLKNGSSYNYFLALRKAYGIEQSYPCGGKTSGMLEKGGVRQTTLNASFFDGIVRVECDSLISFTPQTDSIEIRITSDQFFLPDDPNPLGGGGVFLAFIRYELPGTSNPTKILFEPRKTQCGVKTVKIHKRKMGLVTNQEFKITVRPNETTVLKING